MEQGEEEDDEDRGIVEERIYIFFDIEIFIIIRSSFEISTRFFREEEYRLCEGEVLGA